MPGKSPSSMSGWRKKAVRGGRSVKGSDEVRQKDLSDSARSPKGVTVVKGEGIAPATPTLPQTGMTRLVGAYMTRL